jgi:hypothetical protein
MVGDQEASGRIDVRVAHEEVIILEADRPVLGEGVFDADANRSAAAGFAGRIEADQRSDRRVRRLVVGHMKTITIRLQDNIWSMAFQFFRNYR